MKVENASSCDSATNGDCSDEVLELEDGKLKKVRGKINDILQNAWAYVSKKEV